ncbi:hypothetical protein JW865_09600 [Candidatus Bathyarchaeota archaeon]|nr:hypothetical protein [Candidatus Bathyarchaeota archaeon]
MSEQEKEHRWNIFRELLPYYGKLVTLEFLQKTPICIPAINRTTSIHYFSKIIEMFNYLMIPPFMLEE